ncbi:MAG: transglycosylase domain-containing protein, partial [Clostridia bacterium]|nr:transglycosylase domain-containing protein [Clostridia bacterium]
MEKAFKKLLTVLSYMLICTVIALTFLVPTYKVTGKRVDFFSALEIVDNIKNLEMNMTTIIYAQDTEGNWQEYRRLHGNENRIWVSMDKMPEHLKNAFIAIEDETFRTHSGINWKRTLGAIGNFFFKFDETQFGGSTITQQLIKNITMDKGKNAYRKIREIIRALIVENNLDKDEILEAY